MLKLKLQCFGHLMWRAYSLEKNLMLEKIEGRRRMGWQKMRWLDSIIVSVGMNLGRLQETEGQGSLACCSSWDSKSRTWLSHWTTTTVTPMTKSWGQFSVLISLSLPSVLHTVYYFLWEHFFFYMLEKVPVKIVTFFISFFRFIPFFPLSLFCWLLFLFETSRCYSAFSIPTSPVIS